LSRTAVEDATPCYLFVRLFPVMNFMYPTSVHLSDLSSCMNIRFVVNWHWKSMDES